jgi:DNA-binding transcriptional LysR family regulator
MTPTLDIDLLRSLVAFADSGSFTKAAGVIGRTQSAVSMQMKRLEEMVGKPLFARDGRDLTLTHDGERMVGYARRMLKLHEEAVASFAEPMLTGTVRVGIPDDYAVSVLPVLFSRFAESYPGVHLEVHCESSDLLYPRIRSGLLDLAVLTEQDIDRGGRLLRQEPVVWATSRQHLTHRLDPLPLAVFPAPCVFRKWATQRLEALARPYRIAYSSRSMAAISVAVTSGLAITPIATSSMTPDMRVLTEAEGFPPLQEARISLYQASNTADPAIARLVDHIVQSFLQELPVTTAA